jgi:hypothetical protein
MVISAGNHPRRATRAVSGACSAGPVPPPSAAAERLLWLFVGVTAGLDTALLWLIVGRILGPAGSG